MKCIRKIPVVVLTAAIAVAGILAPMPGNPYFSSIASASGTAVSKSPNIVYLSKKSSVKLMSADIVQNEGKEQIVFKLRVFNNEAKSLDLLNYWFRLKDKKGKSYKANIVQPEQSKSVIAGSFQDLIFVADIGQKRKVDEFNIICVGWDFSLPNYERSLGTIVIPKGYTKIVQENAIGSFTIGSTSVKSVISSSERFIQNEIEKYQVTIEMRNTGKWSATLGADTLYYIRTQTGYVYPMKAKEEVLTLLPQQKKKLELSGEVPKDVNLSNSDLLIGVKEIKSNLVLPVITHRLPAVSIGKEDPTEPEIVFGKAKQFKVENQLVSITGEQIYRYPDQNHDWLAATFKLSNSSKTDLKLPEIEASIAFNGINVKDKAVLLTDGNNIMKANYTEELTILIPLSYKENYSSVTISLNAKQDETTQTIGKFKVAVPQNSIITKRSLNESWSSYDGSAEYISPKAIVYKSTKTDIVAVEVDYKNLEQRQTDIKELKAFLVNGSGNIYPAEFKLPANTKLGPGGTGKALVYVKIPKNVGFDDFQLILGEQYKSGEQVAYYNPVSVNLNNITADSTDIKNMMLGINTLATRSIIAMVVDEARFKLDFEYDLLEGQNSYEWSWGDQKLSFEIVDSNGAVYEKTVNLIEGADSPMLYGKNKQYSITFTDSLLFMRVPVFKTYTLNVYEEFEGHKRLIGKKLLEWMTRSVD